MTLKQVKYIEDKDKHDLILSSLESKGDFPKSWLSPISTQILHQSLIGGVSVVFAQGPLNLTPLICSLLQKKEKQDILIGIPRRHFRKRKKKYSKVFYSLYDQRGIFFYKNILFVTADVKNSQSVSFLQLDKVKSRPNWGFKSYKDNFEETLKTKLNSKECNDWPKIVAIPIDYSLPEGLFQNTEIKYEKESYHFKPFSPSFVILESVNERIFSLNAVKSVINELVKNDIGGIIHFSWPYLPGLNSFLDEVATLENIMTFHLGKRYGIEMRYSFCNHLIQLDSLSTSVYPSCIEDYSREHPGFKELSLEGQDWDRYYPSPTKFSDMKNVDVYIPCSIGLISNEPATTYNHMDILLSEIRWELQDGEISPKFRSLMAFPPFIDSFLRPRDITVRTPLESGEYRSYPIKDAVKLCIDRETPGLNLFIDLCSQLDNVAVFNHILNGLQTSSYIGKSTALAHYIYRHLYTMDENEGKTIHLMVCDYTSQLGSRKKIIDKLVEMLEHITSDLTNHEFPKIKGEFFKKISLVDGKIDTITLKSEYKLIKLDFDISRSKQIIDVSLVLLNEERIRLQKKLMISFIDFGTLSSRPPQDLSNSYLLLPGPIPILSFKKDSPIITTGFDLLLRPFKRIVFFSYPGNNTKRLIEQSRLIDDLMGTDSKSDIALKDLSLSSNHIPKELIVGIKGAPDITPSSSIPDLDTNVPDDNPLDSNFRGSMIKKIKEEDEIEITQLSDIWRDLSKPREPRQYVSGGGVYDYDYERILLKVRFKDTSQEDNIFLNPRSYIRVISENGDSYFLANELEVGQEIIHLQTEEKEGLDNYFIKSFSEYTEWSLEEILEVYTCLSLFLESIQKIQLYSNFDEEVFEGLYWLGLSEKEALYNSIKFLLSPLIDQIDTKELSTMWKETFSIDENIWSDLSLNIKNQIDQIKVIKKDFESGRNYTTYSNLYKIAKIFDLKLTENSFKSLLSSVRSKRMSSNPNSKTVHYFFRKPKSLYAIGKLIGNQDIINNFQEINEAGINIWKILELIGHSISRVKEGKDNPLNEMDQIIRDQMKICQIISIGG
ncbi:MAG: hypothetical protein R6U52_05480 [Kosmotogaceae bacterium]